MYLKNFLAAAAVLAAIVGTSSNAHAVFLTSNGTVEINSVIGPSSGTAPPILDVYQMGFTTQGRAYTNQWDGAPFAVGSEIRTITVQVLTGASSPAGEDNPILVDIDPTAGVDLRQLIVITALKGTIFADPATAPTNPAAFTEGMAFVTYGPATGFNVLDPSSWNFGSTFSQYVLTNDSVHPGFADADKALDFNLAAQTAAPVAGQINTSAPNTVDLTLGDAFFLFTEASTAAQNASAGPDGSGNYGDDFISNVEIPPLAPGLIPAGEGIVSRIDQAVITTNFDTTAAATDLAVLNGIWSSVFAGEDWATAITSDPTDPDQTKWHAGTGANVATGDFLGRLGGEIGVGVQAVPEPGSITLLGLGLAGLGLYGARRRRKS